MSGLTNASVAQQVQALLDTQKRQTDYLTAWLGGSPDGGPNNDGRYPFVDLAGVEILVPAPASFNSMVSGPAALAAVAKVAAELARDLAQGHADRADAQRVLAEAARGAAIDARNLAQEHRSHAGTHEANARYWAGLAQGAGQGSTADREIVEQLAAETADNAALAAQDADDAAASAVLAATFDPALYDKKSDTVPASRLTGVIDVARIPVLPSQLQFVSSGGLANLTTQQQTAIGRGSIVTTTDGFRYVYSGDGSKTVAASYTILADITPAWDTVADKPSYFPSNIANVSGLQSALDGKSAAGHAHAWAEITGKPTTFAPSAHTHLWADLTDKPTTFTPSMHSHVWADITNPPATYAPSAHTQDWSTITGRPTSFAPTAHIHAISDITNLQATLNDKLSLSAGTNTLAGALYVTNRLNINGGDPYLGSDGPTRSIVIAGGGGWTSTGSTIALYGVNHASQAGNMMIQGGETGTRALTITGWNSVYFNVRPSFNGGTPWDSNNFNPAAKADASDWANPNAQAYINSNGQKGFSSGVTGGDIASQAGVAALEVRGGGTGTGAAFLQLHRPGIFATNFGIDTDNCLKIGGWSYGASADNIWHNRNIPTNRDQLSIDSKKRFHFAHDGATYFNAPDGFYFRNNSDAVLARMDSSGNFVVPGTIQTQGNGLTVRGGSPTIYFRDTDQRTAMIHVNSNTFHILRGSGTDTEAWETYAGRWPMTLSLETNDATFGGSGDFRTHVYAGNNVYAGGEVYAANWFRIQSANSGIYWEQFGGGWQMSDQTYMRAYGNKYLYSAGSAGFDGNVNMGSFAVLSDARLKSDIRPLTGHGQLIDRLAVKSYIKGGKPEWGVIAQEVEQVEPMLVIRAGDPNDEWGDEPLRTVDSNSLMFAMLAEVKDLRARVAALDGLQ